MSLVFDALRGVSEERAGKDAICRAPAMRNTASPRRFPYALLGVLLPMCGLLWLAEGRTGEAQLSAAATPTLAAPVAAPVDQPVATLVDQPVTVAEVPARAPVALQEAPSGESVTAPPVAVREPAAQPVAPPADSSVSPPEAEATPQLNVSSRRLDVAAAFRALLVEVRAGDLAAAEARAEAIEATAGADHLLTLKVRGYLAQARGDLELAEDFYTRVLTRVPGDRDALVSLATIGLAQDDLPAARRAYDTLRDRYPTDPYVAQLRRQVR